MTRFETVFRLLTKKNVICQYAQPLAYAYLSNPREYCDMNEYLSRIGMSVQKTKDGLGFYCTYENIDDKSIKNNIARNFEFFSQTMEGLIAWLRLARNIDFESRPIIAGSSISEAELLLALEESESLQNQLAHISNKLKRGHQSNESKKKLRSILDYLLEENYFVSPSTTGSIFIATAKWSLLYEILEFIADKKGLLHAEQEEAQNIDQMELNLYG